MDAIVVFKAMARYIKILGMRKYLQLGCSTRFNDLDISSLLFLLLSFDCSFALGLMCVLFLLWNKPSIWLKNKYKNKY